jgi:hypothetical protein
MDKSTRANASQFFVAGELCRRGLVAVVTLGSTPNTDILCSNVAGTHFVHVQVKTFVPGGGRTCSVGLKAQKDFGENFFWVLGGIPAPDVSNNFEYYVIPAPVMATNVSLAHRLWLSEPGAKGQKRNDSLVRTVHLPPRKSYSGWDITEYRDRWDLIESKLAMAG